MSLRVHGSHRLLADASGRAFFYLADTAWELFHRLSREEADHYLATRAAQGFNVIQAVALAEHDGLRQPNYYGHVPFVDLDPSRPDERYWQHVDWVINRAAELGLWVGLLPTWGDKITLGWSGAAGPEVLTPHNGREYGRFIGARYRDCPIVWILGGDRAVDRSHYLLTCREIALGVRERDPHHLMSFHPAGGTSSSAAVHGESWLDFNMLQTGHVGHDRPVWRMIDLDRAKWPTKPVLDGEPNYEDHPVMQVLPGARIWSAVSGQWFNDLDVRKQAWRSLLAGACGHTYGCHDVWQFFDASRNPPITHARTHWREALRLPGAGQMRHLRNFFQGIDWASLAPDGGLLEPAGADREGRVLAASCADGKMAIAYITSGEEVELSPRACRFASAEWLDVRSGLTHDVAPGTRFRPIDAQDWLLVLRRAG